MTKTMKPKLITVKPTHYAVHKTFKRSGYTEKRELTFYVSDGTENGIEKMNEEQWFKFVETVDVPLRFTAVNATDQVLIEVSGRGIPIQYCHWHDTGIDKGLTPAEIVEAYAKLPQELFLEFKPNPALGELRKLMSIRQAIVQFYGDANRKIQQTGRNLGLLDKTKMKLDATITEGLELLSEAKADSQLSEFDRNIAKSAAKIRECRIFNETAGISSSSWNIAASFVAFSGGLDRFDTIGAFWKYCGLDVVDGRAPSRKRGNVIHWNPKLRLAAFHLGNHVVRHGGKKAPHWRALFDDYKAEALARHDERCSLVEGKPCTNPQGHCDAMARRKVVKEILKEWFLSVKGIEYAEAA